VPGVWGQALAEGLRDSQGREAARFVYRAQHLEKLTRELEEGPDSSRRDAAAVAFSQIYIHTYIITHVPLQNMTTFFGAVVGAVPNARMVPLSAPILRSARC
jgi:hypothetical protein